MSPVVLDSEAARRIGVAFTTVTRKSLPSAVEAVGTVTYDETRLASVNLKVEGWVEELHVDFTGAPVREGEPLLDLYSPALVAAQEELILAARLARDASSDRLIESSQELLAASRRRLAHWDIPPDEIQRIEQRGEPDRTLTFRSPATGVVVAKNVIEGDRIAPGMTVYRIADLSRVWIEVEIFEKDLTLVAMGQSATVTLQAYPGRTFRGRVTYIHPTVSVQSRTARIRLELPNGDSALKPGMYAQIHFESMPTEETLVVPRSAVIQTGQRALVFVEDASGALVPREVTPGRVAGREMELLDGVVEGERVVSSAAFLVDAESNLGTMTAPVSDGAGMEVDHSAHLMEGGASEREMTSADSMAVPDPMSHDGHGQ